MCLGPRSPSRVSWDPLLFLAKVEGRVGAHSPVLAAVLAEERIQPSLRRRDCSWMAEAPWAVRSRVKEAGRKEGRTRPRQPVVGVAAPQVVRSPDVGLWVREEDQAVARTRRLEPGFGGDVRVADRREEQNRWVCLLWRLLACWRIDVAAAAEGVALVAEVDRRNDLNL